MRLRYGALLEVLDLFGRVGGGSEWVCCGTVGQKTGRLFWSVPSVSFGREVGSRFCCTSYFLPRCGLAAGRVNGLDGMFVVTGVVI